MSHQSVRALLNSCIDYAGLFPPAELSMEQAVQNYASYARGPYAWMLGRFVCSVPRLQELEEHFHAFGDLRRVQLALIARGGEDLNRLLFSLREDMEAATALVERESRVAIDTIEMRIPGEVMKGGSNAALELAERAGVLIADKAPGSIRPFLEVTFDVDVSWILEVLQGIQRFNQNWAKQRFRPFGAKIRTGGATAAAYPEVKQVAFFVTVCQQLGLSFKATAGLHHPIRHFNKEAGVEMHGFVNLLTSASLGFHQSLHLRTMVQLLECEQADQFEFSEEGLVWQGNEIPIQTIARARQQSFISFGSCSFEEPIEDLKQLGIFTGEERESTV